MRVHKTTLILVDGIVTYPCVVLGFVFELVRLAFMSGREKYVKYLIWLVKGM